MKNSKAAIRFFCGNTLSTSKDISCGLPVHCCFKAASQEHGRPLPSRFLHAPATAVIDEAYGGWVGDARGGGRRPVGGVEHSHVIRLAGAHGGDGCGRTAIGVQAEHLIVVNAGDEAGEPVGGGM